MIKCKTQKNLDLLTNQQKTTLLKLLNVNVFYFIIYENIFVNVRFLSSFGVIRYHIIIILLFICH